MGDAAALDDLLQAGGQHVVLDLHAQGRAEVVDAAEPLSHAGEQLHGLAAAHQKVTGQGDALGAALGDHGIHIGQQAVHAVLPAKGVGLVPELLGRVAQGRDKGVVLHVGGAEGLVKVVQQGDDGLAHSGSPSVKKGGLGRLFYVLTYCRRSCGQTSARPGSA